MLSLLDAGVIVVLALIAFLAWALWLTNRKDGR